MTGLQGVLLSVFLTHAGPSRARRTGAGSAAFRAYLERERRAPELRVA